jgi:threonyl-tRNA synthetase
LDLLQNLNDGEITFYTQGNFTDLCRGPHIPNTGFIKAIKLTNIAGAYWKGDEKISNLPVFTVLRSLLKKKWMNIWLCWKKPKERSSQIGKRIRHLHYGRPGRSRPDIMDAQWRCDNRRIGKIGERIGTGCWL